MRETHEVGDKLILELLSLHLNIDAPKARFESRMEGYRRIAFLRAFVVYVREIYSGSKCKARRSPQRKWPVARTSRMEIGSGAQGKEDDVVCSRSLDQAQLYCVKNTGLLCA